MFHLFISRRDFLQASEILKWKSFDLEKNIATYQKKSAVK